MATIELLASQTHSVNTYKNLRTKGMKCCDNIDSALIRNWFPNMLTQISTFSCCCKHFWIPKICTFTWCTSNMVQ